MPHTIFLDIYQRISYLATIHGTHHKIKEAIMGIPSATPLLVSHFSCEECHLKFRTERPTFLEKECCPSCHQVQYSISWSFTTRSLVDTNIHKAIDRLTADIAYAIHKEEALFPEPTIDPIILMEVNADHYVHADFAEFRKMMELGDHE